MGSVEYEGADVAATYARGRQLGPAVLERWRTAVTPLLPRRPHLRVADVGAGTGIFARAWPTWHRCDVIAFEPAAGMCEQLARDVPAETVVVRGRAEQLPLRSSAIDVAWLSASLHHVRDQAGCAGELRRVLTRDGVVLIRGLFADRGRPAGIELLPGHDRVLASFPSVRSVTDVFIAQGFAPIADVEVEDAGPRTVADAGDHVRRMRDADTLLGRFTDDEIEAGLAEIKGRDPTQRLESGRLGLLALRVA